MTEVRTLDDALAGAVADALRHELPAVIADLADLAGPRAYSVVEVAERLDISETSVRNLIRDGHLRPVPHLNPTKIAAHELDVFLAGKR